MVPKVRRWHCDPPRDAVLFTSWDKGGWGNRALREGGRPAAGKARSLQAHALFPSPSLSLGLQQASRAGGGRAGRVEDPDRPKPFAANGFTLRRPRSARGSGGAQGRRKREGREREGKRGGREEKRREGALWARPPLVGAHLQIECYVGRAGQHPPERSERRRKVLARDEDGLAHPAAGRGRGRRAALGHGNKAGRLRGR